jgi:hypothetical protein
MIYIKVHRTDNGAMLAMCDADLIDKVIDDGKVCIDLKGYSDFYKGELVKADLAKERIGSYNLYSVNVVGNESVKAAIEGDIIKKENVKSVNGIMYANAYRVDYP